MVNYYVCANCVSGTHVKQMDYLQINRVSSSGLILVWIFFTWSWQMQFDGSSRASSTLLKFVLRFYATAIVSLRYSGIGRQWKRVRGRGCTLSKAFAEKLELTHGGIPPIRREPINRDWFQVEAEAEWFIARWLTGTALLWLPDGSFRRAGKHSPHRIQFSSHGNCGRVQSPWIP